MTLCCRQTCIAWTPSFLTYWTKPVAVLDFHNG
jgi:hypothetical protein